MSKRAVPLGHWVLFWSIALGGAGFDLATKSLIFDWVGDADLRPPAKTIIPGVLELQTSYNPGALWGFARTWPYASLVFAGLSVVAGVAIVFWLFVRGAAADRRLTVALSLIMAGALGNCYDRLVYGRVRDFVHFHVDPINFECAIFNFADNMLVAGALILMVLALRPERPAQDTAGAGAEATPPASTEPIHAS